MLPYIAGFSKYGDRSKFVVAGSGLDKLLVYNTSNREKIGETAELPAPVFSMDFAESADKLAIGLANGEVYVYNV